MSELTLGGVFFLALNHAYLSNLALCQQLQFVPNCLLSRSSDDISLVAAYGSEQPGTVCQGYIVLPLYDGYLCLAVLAVLFYGGQGDILQSHFLSQSCERAGDRLNIKEIVRINVPYERMMNGSMPFPGSTAVWDYDSLSHQW